MADRDFTNWRSLLPALQGFPLIPVGAGPDFKAPIDFKTGKPLTEWQNAAYTPAEIAAMNGVVRSVGTRTGPDAKHSVFIDLDGASAVQFAKDRGCSLAQCGWGIKRTTSVERLKSVFHIPEDLRHFLCLPDGSPIGKVVLVTKQPVYDLDDNGNPKRDRTGQLIKLEPSEQIEIFYGTGQCIVLGEHVKSGGFYTWHGSPTDINEPTPEWWQLITDVLDEETRRRSSVPRSSRSTSKSDVLQSGPRNPCPICGRNTSGACTQYIEGDKRRINCFEGQSFSPPVGLKLGDTHKANDGITYGFAGSGINPSIGYFAKFIEHTDRPRNKAIGGAPGDVFKVERHSKQSFADAVALEDQARDADPGSIDDLSLKEALKKAISSTHSVRALRLGLELLDEIESPTERFVALQRLKEEAGLSKEKAFDQAIATLIDEQHNDKDCSLAELMARQHDASWIIDQFAAKGALIGLGGDKGDGKTTLMYQAAIAVASGQSLFGELTVEQGPAVIVQCDESDLNARKKFLSIGADSALPIHWMWGFNPSNLPELKRKIQRTGAKFIGIDSITTVAGGRGIKSSDPEYALFLYQLNALAAELGVCVAILIHLRKSDTPKSRTSVGLDDFLGTGMLTAACSDVFGYWPNRQEDAFPDQFILRCLGKRNCEAGVSWDLQGSKDDYSLTFVGVQGGGATPSEQRSTIAKALDFLRQRQGQPFTPYQIGLGIDSHEKTIARLLRDYYSSGNPLKLQRIKQASTGGRPSWSWMF